MLTIKYFSLERPLNVLASIFCAILLGSAPGAWAQVSGKAEAPSFAKESPDGKILERSKTSVKLAEDSKALVPIVISPESSPAMKRTAADLAAVLKRITGADFAIKESREPEGITVGTLSQFPDESLKKPLEIKDVYDGVEAYVIRSDSGKIRLLGNNDLGASHAVYRLLELFGYRQYFMGSNWEIIPELKNLSFNMNDSGRPAVLSRVFGFTRLYTKGEDGDPSRPEVFQQWKNANRVGQSLKVSTSHTWHMIPNAFKSLDYPFKKEFDAHPEYFALVDGKRTPPQLCVSNKDLQKLVINYANRYFEVNPDADMVSLDTADQAGWCTCDDCKKLGHQSAQPFYLANIVAKELQKTQPGKYIGLLAYSWHSDPPEFGIEPNIFVQITAGLNSSQYSFDELFNAWGAKCRHIGIYEYYTYWEMDRCMLPGQGPHNKINELPALMKKYAGAHVAAISAESAISWGTHGLGYYLANRLMWDPNADLSALKSDFYQRAFGPAAAPMERYYERLDTSRHPFRGISLFRKSLDDLNEASKLANARPDVLARVEDLKANLVYTVMGDKVEDATNQPDAKERALEWFTWAYRMRNSYMTDWLTFRAAVGNHEYKRSLAFKFNEPSWNYKFTKDNPWRNDQPVTSSELNERLAKIRAEWGDAPMIPEEIYSNNYTLVKLDESGKAERKQAFLGSAAFLLASPKGQPLRFKLFSEPSPNLERQAARYSLAYPDGKIIKEGKLPERESSLELEVPEPGIYKFSCRRGGAGWNIELPPEIPAAVLVERGSDLRPHLMKTFFYVPKGIAKIAMYAESGMVTVRDSENRIVYKGNPNGDFVQLNVASGTDGKAWSLSGRNRNLWFSNIPTILSMDSQSMILPMELAKRDHCEISLKK